MADDPKLGYFLSVGRRVAANGKLKYFFLEIDEDTAKDAKGYVPTGSDLVSFGSDKVKGSPGSIFAMPAGDKDNSYEVGAAKYIGKWTDDVQCMKWVGAERANMAEYSRVKELKQATGLSAVLASLDDAREAYARTMGSHRPQLLAAIVEYITRG